MAPTFRNYDRRWSRTRLHPWQLLAALSPWTSETVSENAQQSFGSKGPKHCNPTNTGSPLPNTGTYSVDNIGITQMSRRKVLKVSSKPMAPSPPRTASHSCTKVWGGAQHGVAISKGKESLQNCRSACRESMGRIQENGENKMYESSFWQFLAGT